MRDKKIGDTSLGSGSQLFDDHAPVVPDDQGAAGIPEQGAGDELKAGDVRGDDQVLNENDISAFILACKKESETTFSDLREVWKALWAAAQGEQDFTKKKEWQAKVVIPEIPPMIKKATSLICRILLKNENYFALDPGLIKDEKAPGKVENPYIEGQKVGIRFWLDAAKAEKLFREWIEAAFTYGIGYIKWWWQPIEKTRIVGQKNQIVESVPGIDGQPDTLSRRYDAFFERETYESSTLAGRVVPPESIYTDADHTFYIEQIETTMDQVVTLAEGGLLDMEAVERMQGQDYGESTEEKDRLERLKLNGQTNEFKKRALLQTYWGNILDRNGKTVFKNAQVILGNEKYVLNPSNIANPFWHQKTPFIELSPIRHLFRKEGKGLAQNFLSAAKAINDITNMTLDGMLWKLLKIFEVDPDRLRDPEQFKSLMPGDPILTIGGPGRAINEVQISDIPQGTLNEVEILRRAGQNDSGVNDFLLGGQQNRVQTTATEASIRSSEGNALFEGISRVVEEGIEDSITMVQQLMLQFWDDFSDPKLQEMARKFGLPFASPSRELKLMFMDPNVKVRVRAMTAFFQKIDDLKKYTDFLSVAGKVPALAMRLELRELLDRIIQAFDFPEPDKLVVPPEAEAMIKQAEMMKLMLSVQPPQPPGAPGPQPTGPGEQRPSPGNQGRGLPPPGPGNPGLPPELIQMMLAGMPGAAAQ